MASVESSPLMCFHDVKTAATDFAQGLNPDHYRHLHIAILKGDWESTKAFLDYSPSALTEKVTILGRTPLHVAAVGAQWELMVKLVEKTPADVLAERDLMGCTCLHYVAMGESISAAKALVAKTPSLTQVIDSKGFTPLIYSIISTRCKEMVWHLVLNTTDERPGCPFSGPSAGQLVTLLTAARFHDVTMYLFQRYPNLATISDSNGSIVLNVLSKLPSHFQSGHKLGFWRRCLYRCDEDIKSKDEQVLQGLGGPMTRARAKRVKEALNCLVIQMFKESPILEDLEPKLVYCINGPMDGA